MLTVLSTLKTRKALRADKPEEPLVALERIIEI
jgi:hypothetical protein